MTDSETTITNQQFTVWKYLVCGILFDRSVSLRLAPSKGVLVTLPNHTNHDFQKPFIFVWNHCRQPQTIPTSMEPWLTNLFFCGGLLRGYLLWFLLDVKQRSITSINRWVRTSKGHRSQDWGLGGTTAILRTMDDQPTYSKKNRNHQRGRHDVCHLTPLVSWIFIGIFMRKI